MEDSTVEVVTAEPGTGSPAEPSPDDQRRHFTRRRFLGGAAGVAAAAAVIYFVQGPDGQWLKAEPDRYQLPFPGNDVPDITLQVERDSDLVLLDFFFFGFEIDTTQSPTAIVCNNATNTLIVRFPPQAIGEAVYPDDGSEPYAPYIYDPPPILSAVSGPSQLAFVFSEGDRIPLPTMTAQDLLDWYDWTLSVMPVAQVQGGDDQLLQPQFSLEYPLPSAPGPLDTAIEFPYALYLSPTVYTGGFSFSQFSTWFQNRLEPLYAPVTETVDLFCSALQQSDGIFFSASFPGVGTFGYSTPQLSAIWARDITDLTFNTQQDQDVVTETNVTPEDVIYYGRPPQ